MLLIVVRVQKYGMVQVVVWFSINRVTKLSQYIFFLVNAKTYGMSCTSSSQCDNTAGLICPTTLGVCNCPLSSTTKFCDCSFGQYYDYTLNMCSMCCL